MASKYAKPMQIPADFPDILRNFTREVLRQQGKVETKEAIYAFGSQYFKELVAKHGGANKVADDAAMSALTPTYIKMEEEAIKEFLVVAFNDAQQQDGGMVVYEHFKQILDGVGEQLQLSPTELKALYAEADESEGGVVSCADFLPLGIQALLQLRATHTQRLARIESFSKREAEFFLHGMMQDEMESILRDTFQRADKDEIGALTRLAFMDAIRDADLGLTRREVNILMSEAPVAEDDPNIIVYPDFVPICFPVLKDTYVQGILEAHNNPDWIAQYLIEVFASGDGENTGLLSVAEIARLFRAADVGLTRLQTIVVMAEAQEDNTGFVSYERFAAQISGMVLALTNIDSQQSYAAYLQRYRKTSEYYTVLELNQHTFEQALSRALEAVDESRRGVLVRDEVVGAIRNAFPEITDRQLRSLMALSDPDEMGELDYNLITHSAFQALQKLQEYDMMVAES
ncbi:putative Glutathione Stransferase omegalike protein [Phytophthora cinnamomi]|uniref:putative Glutathione Stransferase omegalike protein n=1 Tax=Phytophthora cinnamomi TaxID=4785 RepID=UPI00355A6387|nr:putative Glutathione Stransferase omegalike protein [Phytophthora cinnamomi]